MRKNLSKKISLLLCSTFFMSSVMSLNFVGAAKNNSTEPNCPGAPKKVPSSQSRLPLVTRADQLEMMRNFLDIFDDVDVRFVNALAVSTPVSGRLATDTETYPGTLPRTTSMRNISFTPELESALTINFRDINRRFVDLFKIMCKELPPDVQVYSIGINHMLEIPDVITNFGIVLSPYLSFSEFNSFIEYFLERFKSGDNLTQITAETNNWLDDFAWRYNLND